MVNGSTDRCTGVFHPAVISYTTSVSVSPAFCVGKPARVTLNPRVLFIGFGEVSLTLEVMCGCDCAAQEVKFERLSIISFLNFFTHRR